MVRSGITGVYSIMVINVRINLTLVIRFESMTVLKAVTNRRGKENEKQDSQRGNLL